jgi:Protein of unknown function (DUF4058)
LPFLQLHTALFGYKMAELTFLISANVFSKLRCRQAQHHKFSPKRLIPKKSFKNPLPEDPIEILTIWDESRVVTVIEVLSPSNKTAGTPGRDLYLTKQRELLESQTHLIELDFLHYGEHTIAPPRARLLEQGTWDYLVSLHRGGQGHRYEVWAVTLQQRLPRIRVPLADDIPDVVLDLQTVFDRCYDAAAYARRLDYHRAPPLSLSQDNAAWVANLLHERGLRA